MISPEEAIKKLREFWLLDASEYTIIKNLIQNEIDRLNHNIKFWIPKTMTKQERKNHNEDVQLRDFYVVLKEKVSYIISNGLCKKY